MINYYFCLKRAYVMLKFQRRENLDKRSIVSQDCETGCSRDGEKIVGLIS